MTVGESLAEGRVLEGTYVSGGAYVSKPVPWAQICQDHEGQFARIRKCVEGSFNVELAPGTAYVPPGEPDRAQRTQNFLSPHARVTRINNTPVCAWIYRGGWGDEQLELLAEVRLSELLNVTPGAPVTITVEEFPGGHPDLPQVPAGGLFGQAHRQTSSSDA